MKKLTINNKIETERLIIEMPKIEDAKELYDLIDDNVLEFMPWDKGDDYRTTEKHIKEVIGLCEKGESWDTLIRRKSDKKIVGKFGIIKFDEEINSIELGYWITKEFWGKGFIPECVEKIKNYGFNELGINRILIRAVKENIKSRRVAEKCGFKFDGILRGQNYNKGKIVDMAYYTILKSDYIKKGTIK